MTIADIAIFSTLFPLYKLIIDPEMQKKFEFVTKYIAKLALNPVIAKEFGKLYLCEK